MAFKLESADDAIDAGLNDINVTPFIDVMLVLLIIFMIAAPLATVNVPLDLPVSSAQAAKDPELPVIVSVQSDLRVYVGDDEVGRDGIGVAVRQALEGRRDDRIFLRADKGVSYGDLMNIMDSLRESGFRKIALVTLDQPGA